MNSSFSFYFLSSCVSIPALNLFNYCTSGVIFAFEFTKEVVFNYYVSASIALYYPDLILIFFLSCTGVELVFLLLLFLLYVEEN